jgi:hypothetical protein
MRKATTRITSREKTIYFVIIATFEVQNYHAANSFVRLGRSREFYGVDQQFSM